MSEVHLQRQSNGDFIDWGRNWRLFGKEGYGGARYYAGEAAEVLELVLKHTKQTERSLSTPPAKEAGR